MYVLQLHRMIRVHTMTMTMTQVETKVSADGLVGTRAHPHLVLLEPQKRRANSDSARTLLPRVRFIPFRHDRCGDIRLPG
jgi:hypothetical protein